MNWLAFLCVLLVLAGTPACKSPGNDTLPPELVGRVLHGRYLHPDALFSIRVLSDGSDPWLVESIGEDHGSLIFRRAGENGTRLTWVTATTEDAKTQLHDDNLATLWARDQARELESLRLEKPESAVVHEETLAWRGGAGHLNVTWVPGGSTWSRVSWFRRRPLDVHVYGFAFVHGDTVFKISAQRTPNRWKHRADPEAGDPTHITAAALDRLRAEALEFADRIQFDDPLFLELEAYPQSRSHTHISLCWRCVRGTGPRRSDLLSGECVAL